MSRGVKILRLESRAWCALALLLLVHSAQLSSVAAINPKIPPAGAANESAIVAPPAIDGQTRVDVRTEVWPIFQRHCLRCHNGEQSDGDLRLDEIDFIRRGGHTGNIILGTVKDSELLRRIVATDPGYRMPKQGTPLSAEDVQVLTRWIEQGASWPANESANPGGALLNQKLTTLPTTKTPPSIGPLGQSHSPHPSWQAWSSQVLDVVSEYQHPMRPLLIGLLFLGVFVLVVERRKRQAGQTKSTELDDWSQRVKQTHYTIILLVFLWVGTVLFYRVHQERLQQRYDQLSEKYQKSQNWTRLAVEAGKQVGPFRLNHPPRLGGTYYRGNDERNQALFNGGFYSTAKMFVSLRDKSSDALTWNDAIDPESLVVCLEIERSPFATPDLFNDDTITNCFLRLVDDRGVMQEPEQRAHLQVLEAGERWRACFPLTGHARKHADLDRYTGGLDLCNSSGHPHYGIRYDVLVADGRIANESELWMGATFLTGNVVMPQEGKIPLREWFDFVPIPEITKENSKDRLLLGITEHLGDDATDNVAPVASDPAEPNLNTDETE